MLSIEKQLQASRSRLKSTLEHSRMNLPPYCACKTLHLLVKPDSSNEEEHSQLNEQSLNSKRNDSQAAFLDTLFTANELICIMVLY